MSGHSETGDGQGMLLSLSSQQNAGPSITLTSSVLLLPLPKGGRLSYLNSAEHETWVYGARGCRGGAFPTPGHCISARVIDLLSLKWKCFLDTKVPLEHGLWSWATGTHVLALPLTNYKSLGSFLNLSGHQLPHLQNGSNQPPTAWDCCGD